MELLTLGINISTMKGHTSKDHINILTKVMGEVSINNLPKGIVLGKFNSNKAKL